MDAIRCRKIEITNKWVSNDLKKIPDYCCYLKCINTKRLHNCIKILLFCQIGNKTYSIEWAEPLCNLDPVNSQTVSQILGLVSCAKKVETDRPIIIISR